MACIYKIENLVNGKFYIGSTIRESRVRMNEHFSRLKRGEHCNKILQRSYNKYGRDNFKFSIIRKFIFEQSSSKEDISRFLEILETAYITLLEPEYNIIKIAENRLVGFRQSEESIKRCSETRKLKNRKVSRDQKINVNNLRCGKRVIGIYYKYNLIKEVYLQAEVAEFIQSKRSAVSNNLTGLSKTVNGYTLKYKNLINE